jgi:hypothetical protein
MSLKITLEAMMKAGCSPEQMMAVVAAHDELDKQKEEAQRQKWREKKRRQRANMSPDVSETHGESRGQQENLGDLSPSNGSPPPISSLNIYPPSLTPSHNIQHRKKNRFSEFWLAYPRKIAKGAAEKAWEKAIRIDEPATILKAVRDYKFSDDKEFIPHPATWLNQKRWQDEQNATIVKIEMTEEERKAKIREIWSTP